MKKLFESRNVSAAKTSILAPDVKIIFTKAPFIQYEQILLDKNLRRYLETIMVSKKILRMGAQKTPIQKTYEINVGQGSLNIDFLGSKKQFDWIELSLVYDKSDKHTTIYDSYNVEKASKVCKIDKSHQNLQPDNDIENLTLRHLLFKKLVAWSCNGSSVAPLTDYINNPVHQELTDKNNYFDVTNDERIDLDLRASSG